MFSAFALLAECGATNTADIGSKLVQAAKKGNLRMVKHYVKAIVELDEPPHGAGDALYKAAKIGSFEIVEYLLMAGIGNDQLAEGLSGGIDRALVVAVKNGNVKMTKCLLEMGTVTDGLAKGLSNGMCAALWTAASKGNSVLLRLLLNTGMKNFRLMEELPYGIWAALYAATYNRNADLLECLVQAVMENPKLFEKLSGMTVRLGSIIASTDDGEIIGLLSRLLEIENVPRIACHVVPGSVDVGKCTICRESLAGNISVLKCRHLFHEKCIENQIMSDTTCRLRCTTCERSIGLEKYPRALDSLLKRKDGKCHKCGSDLRKGAQFRVHEDIDAPADLSVFCCECTKEDAERPSLVLSCESMSEDAGKQAEVSQ